ncbi:hypothetical protein [Polaribacter sp. SA4-12]|uniref:hypothetical protein n=1 Tax=Polaribacter sp. SA4-12 TaxID=1312072 RepID=UPI000B3D426C|nr:hypothetical protein [Polaribacter sp. SA4-12]ARV16473.1 hypothetical protein BTO07_15610 [Polaribacter sp. SA4-12]
MKTINSILVIFTGLLLINCSEVELYPHLPYFQFQNEDTPNLLNLPELNSRLTFVNQDNEELYFDAVKSESEKQLHTTGSWVGGYSTKYFYFDEQTVHLKSTFFDIDEINIRKSIQISTNRGPKEFNDGRNGKPRVISEESRLITNIGRYGPFNNRNQWALIDYKNTFQMSFNNKKYYKANKIDLTKTEAISDNWPLPTLNYIYFDVNEGIIGFDDRNGKEWRLK